MTMPLLPGKNIPDPELTKSTPPVKTSTPTPSTPTPSTPTSSTGSTVNYGGPGKDYNDTDPNARFLGVGGHPEVWKDSTTGRMYLVYFAPDTEPPVPILYETTQDALDGFFGDGSKVVFDKTLTRAEMDSVGAMFFGSTNALIASEGDPWLGFLDRVERLKEVSPWANDDEMLAIIGGAYLEGREVFDWEWETTDWWSEHSDGERAWLKLAMSDPSSAEQKLLTDQSNVRSLFDSIGASGNDPALIEWMARQYSTGVWTETILIEQVEAVTSGWGDMNEGMANWLEDQGESIEVATSEVSFDRVRQLFSKWLGPAYPPSDALVQEWATKIRVANGEDSLIEMLRAQRLALFPEYTDDTLSWDDISGPWKSMAYNSWGVQIDESDPFLQELVRLNDANEAQKLLRGTGFERGYDRVVNQFSDGIKAGMRSNVRGAV